MARNSRNDQMEEISRSNCNLTSSSSTINDSLEVHLIRMKKTKSGLGFSIAGGVGNEHIKGNDGIFITKISPHGAADRDGRLESGDQIISVNNELVSRMTHDEVVVKFMQVGSIVNLKVARENIPSSMESWDDKTLQSDSSSSYLLMNSKGDAHRLNSHMKKRRLRKLTKPFCSLFSSRSLNNYTLNNAKCTH